MDLCLVKNWEEVSNADLLTVIPTVSIVMSAYNYAPYLAQAIDGIISQKVTFPIELIVGEDCSKDSTREIVLDYQKRYPELIRVLYSNKNVGMYNNFQRMYSECRGEFVAFCEGDDYWHDKEKLQRQVEILISNKNIGLVHSNCRFFYDDSGVMVNNYYEESGATEGITTHDVNNFLITGNYFIITCTVCVRKDVLVYAMSKESALFSEEYPFLDLPMWVSISRYSSIYYDNTVLATRRVLRESASHFLDPSKAYLFVEKELSFRKLCADRYNISFELRDIIDGIGNKSLLWLSFLKGDYGKAKYHINELKKTKEGATLRQYVMVFAIKNIIIMNIVKFLILIKNRVRQGFNYGH